MMLVLYIGSRYTVLPNLELGLVLPYYVNLNINNENGLSGAEADFNLGIPLTPMIGVDALMAIGKFTYEGKNYGKSHTGDFAFLPYVGLKYAFTPNFSVQASAMTMLGKEYVVGPDTPIVADLRLKMSF